MCILITVSLTKTLVNPPVLSRIGYVYNVTHQSSLISPR